jgi:M6 family metalloprotease-like protein
MKKEIIAIIIVLFAINIYSNIPLPIGKTTGIPDWYYDDIENENWRYNIRTGDRLLNNFLVLRVEFNDVRFETIKNLQPWNHPHNDEYFQKYMQHTRDFYYDASNGKYELIYTIAPNIYTLKNNLIWYGNDNVEAINRVHLIDELVKMADADGIFIGQDFNGLIIFHAGAGQETDLKNTQSHTLLSVYMTRDALRRVLDDPENEDYKGIPTSQEGLYVSRVGLLPVWQIHPDFDPRVDIAYDILGILTQQIGRLMGFPSLSGRSATYGTTAGPGNFCIMGTGVWNHFGRIPPLPSAWIRYYAGWCDPVLIKNNDNLTDIEISYHQSQNGIPTLYKVEFSRAEYYLIENRQQDFFRDYILFNGRKARYHTFTLTEDPNEQEWYIGIDSEGNEVRMPKVNLMKNSLLGSEWDFFLPNTDANGGRDVDGSGLLIWHIDENIIEANFANGTINSNPHHRGVALKEADGIMHLASPAPHYYMRGSPFDAYRKISIDGNWAGQIENWAGNDYLGFLTKPNPLNPDQYPDVFLFSFPAAESNYGGISFEIYNISVADTVMTFSVRFEPYSEVDYAFENYLEPFVFDSKGMHNKVMYFHSTGESGIIPITIFENHNIVETLTIDADTLMFNYTFDGIQNLVIPAQKMEPNIAILYRFDGESIDKVWEMPDATWVGSPIFVDDTNFKWILSLNSENSTSLEGHIIYLNENFQPVESCFDYDTYPQILSNIIYLYKNPFFINLRDEKPFLAFYHIVSLGKGYTSGYALDIQDYEPGVGTFRIYHGDFLNTGEIMGFIHYMNGEQNQFFVFEERNYFTPNILNIPLPYTLTGQIAFFDTNNNGTADIILPHANGFMVYTFSGNLIKDVRIDNPDIDDDSGFGIIATDTFYIGGFSRNRLMFFDNNFNEMKSLSRTLTRPMRAFPFITNQGNNVYLYLATDFGRVHNIRLEPTIDIDKLKWNLSLGNYHRNALWTDNLVNIYAGTTDMFVKNYTFVYPNPFVGRHHTLLKFDIMPTQDTYVNIKIYNIAGQLIAEKTEWTEKYFVNKDRFNFNPDRWSAGIYYAIVRAKGSSVVMKFTIER